MITYCKHVTIAVLFIFTSEWKTLTHAHMLFTNLCQSFNNLVATGSETGLCGSVGKYRLRDEFEEILANEINKMCTSIISNRLLVVNTHQGPSEVETENDSEEEDCRATDNPQGELTKTEFHYIRLMLILTYPLAVKARKDTRPVV